MIWKDSFSLSLSGEAAHVLCIDLAERLDLDGLFAAELGLEEVDQQDDGEAASLDESKHYEP